MAEMFSVATYIVESLGKMTAMKLQKLMYYAQAWHLVWDEEPLFQEDFEAWANGPVIPKLYAAHRGKFTVTASDFEGQASGTLTPSERGTVDAVIKFYGDKSAQWLSDLTHQESPWLDARGEAPDGTRCDTEISKSSMHEYYSGL